MKSKIIKSKRVGNGTVELFEFQDEFGVIVGYSVYRAYFEKNAIRGASKNEEIKFLNKEDAMSFFNN